MNLLSPVPYFVLFGLFCLAAGWLSRAVNLRNAAQGKGSEYSAPIDGLRGLLAMSVFFHHATVTYFYLRTGVWVPPASNFYAQMGPFAVTMFFFVTGFLFWSKLKKSPGPWSLVAFVKNRGRRLMPAYLFSVVLSIAILLLQFGPGLRVAWPMFIGQVLSWATCGVPFGFPKINGLPAASVVNAGVFWSLRIEWGFYLLLPFVHWFASKRRILYLLLICALMIPVLRLASVNPIATRALDLPYKLAYYTLFCFSVGMITAELRDKVVRLKLLHHWSCTVVALGLWLTTVFVAPAQYGVLESLLLAPIFLIIVSGNNLHGFLTSRAVSHLGTISYSIYLLHGIVLYVSVQSLSHVLAVQTLPAIQYWTLMAGIGIMVVLVSTFSYRWIEYPWIAKAARRRAQSQAPAALPEAATT